MKIAFCFLSIGDVSQPNLWTRFFSLAPHEKYRIYCHPKEPELVTSQFLRNGIVRNRVATKHGDVSLVQATLSLFSAAFHDDPKIQYFVLLSESTIPILPLDQIYKVVERQARRSIVNYSVPPPNSEHHKRLSSVTKPELFAKAFFQHDQWVVLHRSHVVKLLDQAPLSAFKYVFAPDEHYFMNVLVHLKCATLDEFVKHAVTYVNWQERTTKTHKDPITGQVIGVTVHPKTYYRLSELDVGQALGANCWFIRKVDSTCDCAFLSASV